MAELEQPGRAISNTVADEQIGRLLNEYLERRERGERVSKDVLHAEHPELAEVLAEHLNLLKALAPSSDAIQELLAKSVLSPPSSPEFVAELGHYRIKGVIGRGGMGIVLRAIEQPLNRPVALKILRPELAVDHRALVRFEHEAKAAAALRHPNIVTVYACGAQNGTRYLAMEAIDGPSLAERLTQEPALSTQEIRRMFRELLLGLSAAHKAGLVHRDIKPSNLLLDGPDRHVKIADFGLARIAASNTRITQPQAAIGTPEYMSPEQTRGDEKIDHRTDLYSAGVVLYEMLTGRVPFHAETPSALIYAILHTEPPEPRATRREADPHLSRIALRLMAKDPENRFDNATDAIDALDPRRRVRIPEGSRRWPRRLGWASIIVLAALGIAFAVRSTRRDRPIALNNGGIKRAEIGSLGREEEHSKQILAYYGDDPNPKVFLDLAEDGRYRSWKSGAHAAVLWNDTERQEQTVLAAIEGPQDHRGLVALDPHGRQRWTLDLSDGRAWPDCGNLGSWKCMDVRFLDAHERLAVATSRDRSEYPTRISVVSLSDRKVLASFFHLGQLKPPLVIPDFFGPERPAIVAWGLNNKLDGFEKPQEGDAAPRAEFDYVPVIMILDPNEMDGMGPPRTKRFADLPEARPYAYAFIALSGLRQKGHRAPGEEEYRDAEHQETATIESVEVLAYEASGDPERPVLAVHTGTVRRGDEEPSGGVQLLLNRKLSIRSVVATTYEKSRNTREFWDPVWHVLIREYEDIE